MVNKNSQSAAAAKGSFDEAAIHLVSPCVGSIKSQPVFSSISSMFQEGFAFKPSEGTVHGLSGHGNLLFQKHLGSETGERERFLGAIMGYRFTGLLILSTNIYSGCGLAVEVN